ncbi:MAG TPA: peptidylprolyl isomerase [Candidatus Aenigmarchaeota archaeon]|nr:peptidylprolyl isomerase [Candidatus Aenigmarchaeota archaeon]
MKYYFALLSIVLVLGCVGTQSPLGKVVAIGDNVSVDYTGMFENGTVFDSSAGRVPLEFSVGAGQMIKGVDAAVVGMHLDEERNVTIKPDDAYGNYSLSNIVMVSVQDVPDGTKTGSILYVNGQQVRVLDIRNNTVFIDMNHPLAGKTLVFRIRIVKIN